MMADARNMYYCPVCDKDIECADVVELGKHMRQCLTDKHGITWEKRGDLYFPTEESKPQ